MTELAPAGVGAVFGLAGVGAGEALAVASGFLIGVSSSGGATGSTVASAGVGAAFGFAGAGEALAVASGVLVSVCFSGEATGSAVAVTPVCSVALGVVVDPGGHVIQHSAPAGNDRNVNPLTGTSMVSRRDFAFMIHPPFPFLIFIDAHFPSVRAAQTTPQGGHASDSSASQSYLRLLAGWRLASDKFAAVDLGACLPDQCGSSAISRCITPMAKINRSYSLNQPRSYATNRLDGTPDRTPDSGHNWWEIRKHQSADIGRLYARSNFSVNSFT